MPRLSKEAVSARVKLKGVLLYWKGLSTLEEQCLRNRIKLSEFKKWNKAAWDGAFKALLALEKKAGK